MKTRKARHDYYEACLEHAAVLADKESISLRLLLDSAGKSLDKEYVDGCLARQAEMAELFAMTADTITRDGMILEKLHALIARLSTGSDRSKEIAEELKAIVGDAR